MGCAAGKEERHAQPEGVPFGAGTKLVSVLSNSSTADTQRAPDEELDRECSFNFVPAGVLRAAPVTDGRLPEFIVLKSKGQLVTKTIAFEKAVRGGYRHEFLAVSHRWEYSATAGEPRHPDPTGVQFRELQKYLKRNPRIKWVWIEYVGIPIRLCLESIRAICASFGFDCSRVSFCSLLLSFRSQLVVHASGCSHSGRAY